MVNGRSMAYLFRHRGGENMSNMSTPKMNFFASVVSQLSNVFKVLLFEQGPKEYLGLVMLFQILLKDSFLRQTPLLAKLCKTRVSYINLLTIDLMISTRNLETPVRKICVILGTFKWPIVMSN